jgi:hypothetical protein
MLLVRAEEPAPEAEPAMPPGCGGWSDELDARGMLVANAILRPSRTAATVRVRNGQTSRTDGPFAETKEMIAGFTLIECDSIDEAAEIAARHPVAQIGAIEIRPVWET